jgi:glycosyltransferase involved in cell wall biosynthesis
VCNERNLGIPRTRNRGLTLARGEYVAMLDSDDVATPDRLAQQVVFLDQHQDYAVIGSWVRVMDETRHTLRPIGILPVAAADVRSRLLFHCSLSQSSIMARTAVIRDFRYYEDYPVCSDFDLWVRLAKTYKLANLPQFLVNRRLHDKQVTSTQAQLGKEAKLRLFRVQLAELGVEFSDLDVERHFFLLRMKRAQSPLDLSYLHWTAGWLQGLLEANQRSCFFAQLEFSRVIAEIWLAVCWQAAAQLGWQTWRHYWRSPLRRELRPSLQKYLLLWVFRRFPQHAR